MLWILLLLLLIWLDFQLGKRLAAGQNHSKSWQTSIKDVEVFTTGNNLFKAICADIEQAKHTIDIQFFIIRNDRLSNQVYSLLARKQAEGVKVRFLTDWGGSIRFRKKWLQDKFAFQKRNGPAFPLFYHLQRRNHRKVLVVDGQIGYAGGFNLGDEYLGKDLALGKWRDYHIRVTGDIVDVLQESFLNDWKKDSEHAMVSDHGDIEVLASESTTLEQLLLHYIENSEHSIDIGSPYFIPSRMIEKALTTALQRGVQLTILIPDKADHPLTKAAALPYLRRMAQQGAIIRLYKDGFFHGKVIFIDEQFCLTGTANFDRRSWQLNQELNIIAPSTSSLYDKLYHAFWQDVLISKSLTKGWLKHQPLYLRLLAWLTVPIRGLL
ncbi:MULTISPECIES: phospholipase D-like domain-containing protein [Gracilibacillus]|uniref:phospholipase D-like domain-containing protein n=1 Tax=Gracilibacillus TaxID=74385 RepID=UPI0008245EA3|nr:MULTISPECIES: phospholipase D-like domain-containing protein [Gracilibacillus]